MLQVSALIFELCNWCTPPSYILLYSAQPYAVLILYSRTLHKELESCFVRADINQALIIHFGTVELQKKPLI